MREVEIGTKALRILPRVQGGTVAEAVPSADRARPCLIAAALRRLRALGERVEAHYGAPQDIEWALAGDRLHLLQTRPVTAGASQAPVASRAQRAVFEDILEHYPDAPLPLDHAAVTEGYEQLQHMVRHFGLALPPAERLIAMDEDGVCLVDPATPRPTLGLLALPGSVKDLLRLEPSSWPDRLEPPGQTLPALEAAVLETASDTALADHLRAALDLAARVARVRFRDAIAPMLLRGAWLALLARLAGRRADPFEWLGGLSYKTMQIEVALQDLADALPADPRARAALEGSSPELFRAAVAPLPGGPDFLARLDAFLGEHGARAMQAYLPFANRSWREAPAALQATLAAVVRAATPGAAAARAGAGREAFDRLRTAVARRLPGPLRRSFEGTLERYRRGHVAREETLYAVEEAFVQARRTADEAGRRLTAQGVLERPEDVRWLRLDELLVVLRAADGSEERRALQARMARRRARRPAAEAAWASLRPPPVVEGAAVLRGLAGSPGRAEGPARILKGVADFERLAAGDVLVCPFTDPTWTPLFALARAVVADSGGPLSHAAIVAREYGIPAVLGTGVATTWLRDGDLVGVDGTRGGVRRR